MYLHIAGFLDTSTVIESSPCNCGIGPQGIVVVNRDHCVLHLS